MKHILLSCLLLASTSSGVFAQEAASQPSAPAASAPAQGSGDPNEDIKLPTPSYFKRFWGDLKELPTKPVHWKKNDWIIAGSVVGGSFLAFTVDGGIRDYYRDHRSNFLQSVSDVTTHFGDYKQQAPIIMGLWITGVGMQDETMQKMAGDALEASVISAGIITPLLVLTSGRALPEENEDAMKFKPFQAGRYSYPSGHTTAAFALATVLDQNLRKKYGYWQTPLLYGMAVGCAESRIYDAKHYLSDIILGAGIGWSVGYWVANKPRGKERQLYVFPTMNGASLAYKF